jgi:nitroreductase
MPSRNQAALDFLLTRASYPPKLMAGPVPGRAELSVMLTAASRSPDHGKLVPWRFVVLQKPALQRLAALAQSRGEALGKDAEQTAKGFGQYDRADLVVVVVSSPKPSPKVPEVEQVQAAAAVCLALVNAATASGWAACWLSGWPSYDRGFVEQGLGLTEAETVAGVIHIGSETAPPVDRPRPDIAAITTWADA